MFFALERGRFLERFDTAEPSTKLKEEEMCLKCFECNRRIHKTEKYSRRKEVGLVTHSVCQICVPLEQKPSLQQVMLEHKAKMIASSKRFT